MKWIWNLYNHSGISAVESYGHQCKWWIQLDLEWDKIECHTGRFEVLSFLLDHHFHFWSLFIIKTVYYANVRKISSMKYLFEYDKWQYEIGKINHFGLISKKIAHSLIKYTLHAWFSLGFKVKPRQNHTLPLFAQFVTKNPGGKVSSGVFCLRLGAKNCCKLGVNLHMCAVISRKLSLTMTWRTKG